MLKITRQTRLSALRELLRGDLAASGRASSRLVQSIQQSLAAEGYAFSEKSVGDIGEQVLR